MPLRGVTGKFLRPYEGSYMISKVIPPSTVEVCDGMESLNASLTSNRLRFIKKQMVWFKTERGANVGRSNLYYKLHVYRCQ